MSWTVLCIADDASRRLLYQSVLELEGHSVLFAATLADAIKICSTASVSCVVIDRVDGLPFTKTFCRALPKIPILFVTDKWPTVIEIYHQVEMFISREEALEQLPECIEEAVERSTLKSVENDSESDPLMSDSARGTLHQVFIRWMFPW